MHKKTTRAALWSALDVFLRQGAQFIMGMVLARLIAPAEFGLVSLLLIFTGIAGLFIESGFGSALIQQRDHSQEDESTVFWFNLAVGTLMALVLVLAAPWIASFYNQPRLVHITWAMAFNLWMMAWLTVHTALLTKKLDFLTQMRASLTATVVAGFLAIILAYTGAGVWALVLQIVATTAVNVIMVWRLHRWRPIFVFRWDSFCRLFNFGGFLLLSSLLDTIASRFYSILIGKIYSVHDLGIYTRAMTTRDFPQNTLGTIFSRVAFPVFTLHTHDPAKLRSYLKDALGLMMAVNLPVMLGLLVTADAMVPVLFGPQWLPSVPILRVLCVAGILWPMHLANLNVLMAQGYSNLFFRLELLKKVLLVILIVLASKRGMQAIAWATVISSLAGYFINAHYTWKNLHYSAFEQLRDLTPYAALAGIMALLLAMLGFLMDSQSHIIRLVLQVIVGAVFYLKLGHMLGLDAFRHFQKVIRSALEADEQTLPNSGKT